MKNVTVASKGSIFGAMLGIALAVAAVMPARASAALPAQLYWAKLNWVYTSGALTGYNVSGSVSVRPSTLSQYVYVRYTYDGTNWVETQATYSRTAPDGYKVFTFKTPTNSPSFHYYNFWMQYAIRYVEGGTTYWDNNGGQNYYARSTNVPGYYDHPFTMSKSALFQENASRCYGNNQAGGSIILKNLAYTKNVQVIYSTDGFYTSKSVAASYASGFQNDSGAWDSERWSFSLPFACGSTTAVKYKLSYTVNGVTYVDDNFGAKYTLP